jgi:hypothetical protein
MQLAAQRIALNLREAGFNVQVANTRNAPHADLALRSAGENVPVSGQNPTALYRAEHDFLDLKTLIPLLDLPRAWAVGSRVRDLRLRADGTPDFAGVSLEGTQ